MPAKVKKKDPETMLLRIIQVAEILAKGEGIGIILTKDGQQVQPVEPLTPTDCNKQKTQVEHFHVS